MSKSPNISDLIDLKKAELTSKILDYFDGDQEGHLVKLLNDPNKGRKDWQSRGIIPRTRNILKMVVDKSGLLFNDKAPTLDVYTSGELDEATSAVLQAHLENLDWIEFFTNFDSVVRMLKTACILVQYDTESSSLTFDILTQQNSAVVMNPHNKQINTLVYRTAGNADSKIQEFRVFTKELIQDIAVNEVGEESISMSMPNPFGCVPVVSFHDTNTPRVDFWNKIPTDLVQINDMYNLHITDSEYAASWSKLKTLFTNARVASDDYGISSVPQNTMIGGPSQVIQIDTTGVDSAFVEYKGPEVNLQPIDDMVNKWVADFAADWAVNVKFGGSGTADSGFKLIVEEMPNLELRKKRARMFEAGFKRLFRVISKVINHYKPGAFPEDSELFAAFAAPILPVNERDQEEVWTRRIAAGRATRADYFMSVFGMTKQEAQDKISEIDAENAEHPNNKQVQAYTVGV